MKLLQSFAFVLLAALSTGPGIASAQTASADVAVGSQYDSFHVYVAPADFDRLTASLVATFGGTVTKKSETTVTPTASTTFNAAVVTPSGLFSVFGFETPIPYPFGIERTGYLVSDMDAAVAKARSSGAEIVVSPFPDPIGKDAIVRWPGGVGMQFYSHTIPPNYAPLASVPENRVYLSPDSANAFVRDFLAFSGGRVAADDAASPGTEVGLAAGTTFRRVRIESTFGSLVAFVVDAKLPWPYGREQAGIGVSSVSQTIAKATQSGATVVVAPFTTRGRTSATVRFPGDYIVEIHGAP